MFKRYLAGAAFCGGVLVSSAALANGVYVSGSAGGVVGPFRATSPTDITVGGRTETAETTTTFKNALDAEVALGYRFDLGKNGSGIDLELTAQYGQFDVAKAGLTLNDTVNKISATASDTPVSGLRTRFGQTTVNLSYRLPRLVAGISPFFGGGVGYQYQVEDAGSLNQTNVITVNGKTTTSNGAVAVPAATGRVGIWLVQAGLLIPVTKKLSLVPAYRYTSTFSGDAHWQEGRVGLRYDF